MTIVNEHILVTNNTQLMKERDMKKIVVLLAVAASLLLGGCATTGYASGSNSNAGTGNFSPVYPAVRLPQPWEIQQRNLNNVKSSIRYSNIYSSIQSNMRTSR